MLEPTDSTTRRNVLKLTGASLAAVAGSGVASADHEHPDVRTGSGLPRPGGYADLYGDLLEFGEGASSVDVWFQWGDSPEGLVNETPKQTMTSTGQFSETIYGLEEYHKYDYRAVARDGDDGDMDYGNVRTFTYNTSK
jgi:hypothetical protein